MSNYNIKSIKEDFKNKGIFYTPPELAKILKKYITFKPKKVYDPTCGDGELLSTFEDDVKKYGQELEHEPLEIAKQRLINFKGYCGDTLKEPAFLEEKFDCIIANPPFSIKWEPIIDERFIDAPTIPTASRADYAFILHILYYLSDNGVASVLNFPGILYRGNKELQIRKWIIEKNYIERIVNIPGNTFVDTKIATVLIIFKKNKTNTDIIFEDLGLKIEKTISLQKIKECNYDLSISNYINVEKKKEEVNPLELQKLARDRMLKMLENDIKTDLMICEFESLDKKEYINQLKNLLEKFE